MPTYVQSTCAGHDFTPHDDNGRNDPYLRVKLGDTIISRKSNYRPKTNDPEFFEAFELRTTLPGPSLLTVECWDFDGEQW